MNADVDVLDSIGRIVPVIVIDDARHAAAAAAALKDGGIPTAEVTLRTPGALDAIFEMARVPGFTVGAGTVLDEEIARAAYEAGARYLVSPGLSARVAAFASGAGVPYIPGVATSTEIIAARDHGLNRIKLFPAHLIGGLQAVTALTAVFPEQRFMPSGGITLDNLTEYAESPNVFAVAGTWLAKRADISAERFDRIRHLSAEAVAHVSAVLP